MAEHQELYQRAVYYDIALERDVSHEAAFVQAVYQHYTGKPVQSVLDLACGPGYHARALAKQQVCAIGLDLRPEMVAYAQEKALSERLDIGWLAADMRDFTLPAPVDMAICMFDALDALICNDDLVHHLQAVARNLTAGGLYLIDLTHPREISHTYNVPFIYEGKRDGIQVKIVWGTNTPTYDLVTNVAHTALEIHVNDHGRQFVIQDAAEERLLYPQEIILLAKLSGVFKVAGWYGNYDLNQPLDHSKASERMIAILQKEEEEY